MADNAADLSYPCQAREMALYDVSKRGVPVRVVSWSGILRQTKAFTYLPKADARRKSVR
jgi:hypothetical protein